MVPRPPSLAIFTSLAVTITLFIALVMGLVSSQISGDVSEAFKGFLLVVVPLPIALSTSIFLSVTIPYRAFASTSIAVSISASYLPYAVAVLVGVLVGVWLGNLLPFGYDSLGGVWRWSIIAGGPVTWLLTGLLSNHMAAMVERRREYEKGLEELMESRHRIMLVHEQTRKEVAGMLHGRVQSRLVVLGHGLKECQGNLKNGPTEAVESLENATKLLQEVRGGIFKKCVNSQAVYLFSEQHGLEAQERR